uniref:GON domain-containing protein n=1 Tax=Panagrolaimus superbus TaxID=310955 RepID=A0A914XW30_9BILA
MAQRKMVNAGVKKRTIHCKKGRQIIADTECSAFPKPQETEQCESTKCPVYTWKVTPWSKCIDPCKKMNQHRRVYCLNEGGKRAASRMCQNETMPIKTRPCNIDQCPYEWVPGPWSTCSIACGTVSNSFRRIDCKVKRGMRGQNTKLGSEPTVLSRMCMSLKKPEVNKECAMIPCDAEYRWSVLPWGKCSKVCGPGTRRRKTPCLNRLGVRVPKAKCNKDTRPKHRESCFLRNCLPNDCAEIKAQNTITNSIDGNYTVLVAGFRITVYCHLMNNTIPKTFLNIDAESNFGEFYGKRLLYPYTCPYGGKRNDSCACSNDGHVSSGLSRYRRVRVDLHNMKINPHDFTFAQTAYGTPVPYGTAGDCYSASECPQGRFSIDLRGTGLKIVDDLQWMDHGHKSSSKIVRTENNALIRGQCGGFCGECAPDQYKGIIIEIDHKQRPSIGVG